MPANLPPTYYKLKHQHEAAKTDEERLSLLEEMLRIVPKHKGTEKVVSDLRKRIAVLKKESSGKGGKGASKKGYSEHIPKQGAGQIVMLGPPNGGKSQILSNFTKAKSEVSPTPYTTTMPVVGMLQYENIQFQLIDTPSIMQDFISPAVLTLVRNADLCLGVVSLASDSLLDELDVVLTVFNDQRGDAENDEVGYLVVANQLDAPGAPDRLEILTEFYGEDLQIYPISAETEEGKDALFQAFYDTLDIVRVYPKAPGKPIERDDPIVLPNGSTVLDAALGLHKDFAEFKFARIWGPEWHDGQPVSRNDMIYDGDVVEFHL
ncbi:MAG: GTP-binding protein [Candidatus Poribacteria bacterium]|nr:GTP-binding protein [Candidatus Poribacteria bacterium]